MIFKAFIIIVIEIQSKNVLSCNNYFLFSKDHDSLQIEQAQNKLLFHLGIS